MVCFSFAMFDYQRVCGNWDFGVADFSPNGSLTGFWRSHVIGLTFAQKLGLKLQPCGTQKKMVQPTAKHPQLQVYGLIIIPWKVSKTMLKHGIRFAILVSKHTQIAKLSCRFLDLPLYPKIRFVFSGESCAKIVNLG